MSRKTVNDKGDPGIVFDEDNPEWTEGDFRRSKPASELPADIQNAFPRMRGRQKSPTKVAVSIRLSEDVVRHFKDGGPGWQTRIDEALRWAIGAETASRLAQLGGTMPDLEDVPRRRSSMK